VKLTHRSKLTLCELLTAVPGASLVALLAKHGVGNSLLGQLDPHDQRLREPLSLVKMLPRDGTPVSGLASELLRRKNDFRQQTSPRYVFDQRWAEVEQSIFLDGYRPSDKGWVPIDPEIAGLEPLEDDLIAELRASGLGDATEVINAINGSANQFTQAEPDHTASMTAIRIALDTLLRAIANERDYTGQQKWGHILGFLSGKQTSFVTKREEEGLSGVYSFISEGSHRWLDSVWDREMTRLGRNFALGMCYFLVKQRRREAEESRTCSSVTT